MSLRPTWCTYLLLFAGALLTQSVHSHPGIRQHIPRQTSTAFNEAVEPKREAVLQLANAVQRAFGKDTWCKSTASCSNECAYHDCDGLPGPESELTCQKELVYCCKVESGEQLLMRDQKLRNFLRQSSDCEKNCEAYKDPELRYVNYKRPLFRTPKGTITSEGNNKSIVIGPSNLRRDICALKTIQEDIKDAHQENDLVAGLYAGTTNGAFVNFPGKPFCRKESSDPLLTWNYDPTVRPWYITAATGPRDIVFMLDKNVNSNTILYASLQQSLKQLDSRDAVSLQIFDKSTVSVVGESPVQQDGLTFATRAVREEFQNALGKKQLGAVERSNLTLAVEKAFDTLIKAKDSDRSSDCIRYIILMLADEDSCFDTCASQDCRCVSSIKNFISANQDSFSTPISIIVFTQPRRTMSVLQISNMERMASSIACPSGVHSKVNSSDTGETGMNAFPKFAAFLVYDRESSDKRVFATEKYKDAGGLGDMFTLAIPIYDIAAKELVAVVGADITFSELQEKLPGENIDDQVEANSRVLRRCNTNINDLECEANSLRSTLGESSVCPEKKSTEDDCIVHNSKIYRRRPQRLNYNDARKSCQNERGGGSLAAIESADVNKFFTSVADEDGSWIGAKGSTSSKLLRWDSSLLSELRGQTLNYSEFGFSATDAMGELERLSYGEACVSVDRSSSIKNWNIVPCDRKLFFVCELESDYSSNGCFSEGRYEVKCSRENTNTPVCSVEQNEELNNADPLCKQSGKELDNEERKCCGEEPDPSSTAPSDPSEPPGPFPMWIIGVIVGGIVLIIVIIILIRRFGNSESALPKAEDTNVKDSSVTPDNTIAPEISGPPQPDDATAQSGPSDDADSHSSSETLPGEFNEVISINTAIKRH